MLLSVPGETAPSCREAGEECALMCWGVRVPAVPASELACTGIEDYLSIKKIFRLGLDLKQKGYKQ